MHTTGGKRLLAGGKRQYICSSTEINGRLRYGGGNGYDVYRNQNGTADISGGDFNRIRGDQNTLMLSDGTHRCGDGIGRDRYSEMFSFFGGSNRNRIDADGNYQMFGLFSGRDRNRIDRHRHDEMFGLFSGRDRNRIRRNRDGQMKRLCRC